MERTKNTVIGEIANSHLIEEIIESVAKTPLSRDSTLKDLAQDLYLSLLSKDDDLILSLYDTNSLRWFITRAVLNNLRSKNSPYYYTYKKRQREEDDITKYNL